MDGWKLKDYIGLSFWGKLGLISGAILNVSFREGMYTFLKKNMDFITNKTHHRLGD